MLELDAEQICQALHAARLDTHLFEKDPGKASTSNNLQEILKSAGTSIVSWVEEAGCVYHSGHHFVTDPFICNLWYFNQLGGCHQSIMTQRVGAEKYDRWEL